MYVWTFGCSSTNSSPNDRPSASTVSQLPSHGPVCTLRVKEFRAAIKVVSVPTSADNNRGSLVLLDDVIGETKTIPSASTLTTSGTATRAVHSNSEVLVKFMRPTGCPRDTLLSPNDLRRRSPLALGNKTVPMWIAISCIKGARSSIAQRICEWRIDCRTASVTPRCHLVWRSCIGATV